MSAPAMSSKPPLDAKAFCMSTTTTAAWRSSISMGSGLALSMVTERSFARMAGISIHNHPARSLRIVQAQNEYFSENWNCRGLNIVRGPPKPGLGTGGPAAGQPAIAACEMAIEVASL